MKQVKGAVGCHLCYRCGLWAKRRWEPWRESRNPLKWWCLPCAAWMVWLAERSKISLWSLDSIKSWCSSAPRCPPCFGNHRDIKSSFMQFWSRFSRDAFALGSSLVSFIALHHLKTSLSWSRYFFLMQPLKSSSRMSLYNHGAELEAVAFWAA